MDRSQPSTPRAAFGIAAIALTALTFGLAVVVPTRLDSGNLYPRSLAAVAHVPLAVTEAAVIPYRIEVIGVRDPKLASSRSSAPDARCTPHG